MGPTEVRLRKIGVVEIRSFKMGCTEVCPFESSPSKGCAFEVSICEKCPFKVGSIRKRVIREIRFPEIKGLRFSCFEVARATPYHVQYGLDVRSWIDYFEWVALPRGIPSEVCCKHLHDWPMVAFGLV